MPIAAREVPPAPQATPARPAAHGRPRLVTVPAIGVVRGATTAPVLEGTLVSVPGAGVVPARAGHPRPGGRDETAALARALGLRRSALPAHLVGARLVTVPGIGVVRGSAVTGHPPGQRLVSVPGAGVVPACAPGPGAPTAGRAGGPAGSVLADDPAPAGAAPTLTVRPRPARSAAPGPQASLLPAQRRHAPDAGTVVLPGQRSRPGPAAAGPVLTRLDRLEALLAAAPADARAGGDPLLRRALAAEFVPAELGGHLEHLDVAARAGRAVFRHDAALGVRSGATWLPALAPVWTAGTPAQRRETAALLLAGGRLAFAPHRPPGAPGDGELTAVPAPGGFVMDGAVATVGDPDADALLAVTRTAPGPGAGSHTLLLVGLPGGSPGGRAEFDGHLVPGARAVGVPGAGVPLSVQAFGSVWSTVPGMQVGAGETALRTAVAAALETPDRTGDRPGRSHHRSCLADAFATLLVCDSLALAAARAAHVVPGHALTIAAAARYLVPRLLRETAWDLAAVLGERFHTGGARALRRHLAALPAAGLGHAGTAACRSVLLPLLAAAAAAGPDAGPPAPAVLSGPHDALPSAPRLAPRRAGDPLAARLAEAAAVAAGGAREPEPGAAALAGGAAVLAAERERLWERFAVLGRAGRPALATPRAFALADRYALVLAGAAALGVWQRHAQDPAAAGGFLAGPAWAAQALRGINRRLGLPVPSPEPGAAEAVLGELLERFRSGGALDLHGSGTAPGAPATAARLTGMAGSPW